MSVKEDNKKVKDFVNDAINDLENDKYAYLSSGYIGDNNGGRYDKLIQANANRIVSKLTSLGYKYTTNHGHGCYDWKFFKEEEI